MSVSRQPKARRSVFAPVVGAPANGTYQPVLEHAGEASRLWVAAVGGAAGNRTYQPVPGHGGEANRCCLAGTRQTKKARATWRNASQRLKRSGTAALKRRTPIAISTLLMSAARRRR